MTDDIKLDFTGPTQREPFTLWQGDTNFGPVDFECAGQIPSGVTLTDATFKTYLDGAEVDLVTAGSVSVSGTKVSCRFTVPADATPGYYYWRVYGQLSNMAAGETKMMRGGPITVNEIPTAAT